MAQKMNGTNLGLSQQWEPGFLLWFLAGQKEADASSIGGGHMDGKSLEGTPTDVTGEVRAAACSASLPLAPGSESSTVMATVPGIFS